MLTVVIARKKLILKYGAEFQKLRHGKKFYTSTMAIFLQQKYQKLSATESKNMLNLVSAECDVFQAKIILKPASYQQARCM